MAAAEELLYYGTWKIIECVSLAGVVEITGIEGAEFVLDENGDVSWEVPDDAEQLPFFNCETYEVCPAAGSEPASLKFSGTYAGQIVEFRVDVSDDLMLLTYEKCCMLQCQKVAPSARKDESPYSLVSALEHGFFSDVIIKADSGKEFKVHSLVLRLTAPELDWLAEVPPLTGLPEDVLSLSLFFLYAECLPRGLSENTAQRCAKMVGKMPGFSRLGQMCRTFLENTAFTQQIRSLIDDMHKCTERINSLFGGQTINMEDNKAADDDEDDDDERVVPLEGTVWTNPAKLCYTVRQAMREEALATAKLVILCDLFAKRKHELSREERHEIMKYIKSRIPVFLKQIVPLLKAIKTHLQSLTQCQRNNIATYLVPEMETILDILFRFADETKVVLEQAINASQEKVFGKGGGGGGEKMENNNRGSSKKHSGAGMMLGKTLRHALHAKELKKLKHFHDRATYSFNDLRQKRDNFNMKSEASKVRTVSQALVHLSDEFPFFMMRLKELVNVLDSNVTWKEWKYLFKMATSKVSWCLGKVQSNKETLQPMLEEICGIVRSDEFDASLVALGLKTPTPDDSTSSSKPSSASAMETTPSSSSSSFTPSSSLQGDNNVAKYVQLSSVESLCVSPSAAKSVTARRALELFREGSDTDMVFEVINLPDEGGDIVIDHTEALVEGCAGAEGGMEEKRAGEVEVVEFRAHQVIVAARCDRFRRALLSGMQESINRKIVVHDAPPELFLRCLEALYSGVLDTSGLNVEHLADMMTLCDRYEMDWMKRQCEGELRCLVDEENVLCLLNLADHLHSKELRDCTLRFIAEHQDLVEDCEVYDELPEHLKEEVQDAIDWRGLDPHSHSGKSSGLTSGSRLAPSGSMTSLSEVDELTTNLSLQDHDQSTNASSFTNPNLSASSTSSSSEDLALVEDVTRLEACLQDLLNVIGDAVPRDELSRIAIAADYDTNRALNFFFSS